MEWKAYERHGVEGSKTEDIGWVIHMDIQLTKVDDRMCAITHQRKYVSSAKALNE